MAGKTDEEAVAIFREMENQARTLFRALDTDGDGVLSAEEIAAAPDILRALDTDNDGRLDETDMGGPTFIPGAVRRSNLVKMLDEDGDLIIDTADIDAASERLLRLDRDGDGRVTMEDDIPTKNTGMENQLPMGTPAQALEFQVRSFTRVPENNGPLLPAGQAGVQPGYMLIQEMNDYTDVQISKKMFLMDEHGREVHQWKTNNETPEATVAYLLSDGRLLRTTCKHHWMDVIDEFPVGAHGTITIEGKDSEILWEFEHFQPGRECLHHDVEMMPNGNVLAIAWHRLSVEQAQAIGWKQQGKRARVFLDKILEIRPDYETGKGEIVWEWALADHVIQNVNPDGPNYGDPAKHPEKIDINWPELDRIPFNINQLAHINSVSYDPEEDIIMLSSAIFNEIWIIDHSASATEVKGASGGRYGKGGDLIFRYGNPRTFGAGGESDQVLYWQHAASFLSDDVPHKGDLIVFNNGFRRTADGRNEDIQQCMGVLDGAYSEVLELELPRDENGMLTMSDTAEIVWSFDGQANGAVYSPYMSGADRLANGNTIMVQAYNKRIVEVTEAGDIVLDFQVGGPGRMFRIYKYAPDHPGIRALGL